MALAPLFIALLALVLILGLLPIPQLRSLILSAQTTLIGTVGDSLAFVESPIRAALIRNRILEGLERLKDRCERTVIVAHSQGAAAVFDALGGIPQAPDHDMNSTSPEPPRGPVPDTLVTFGSGVNQLASLRFLSTEPPDKTTETNSPYVAVGAILVIIILLGYLFVRIRSGSTTAWHVGEAAAVWSGVMLGSALLIWSADRLIDTLTARGWLPAREKAADKKLRAWAIFPVIILALGFFFFYFLFLRPHLPAFPVMILYIALILLAASLVMILLSSTEDMVANSVEKPRGLTRWIDLYASADPVPNGPTMLPAANAAGAPSAEVESVLIWNCGAMLSDHTTYWDNLDGFVLRIARVCAETAKSPWQRKLPDATQMSFADRLAKWRVGLPAVGSADQQGALGIRIVSALAAIRAPACRYHFALPSWFWNWRTIRLHDSPCSSALVVLAAWVAAGLLRWRWSVWVRADQEAVLAQKAAGVVAGGVDPFSGQGTVVGFLGLLVLALVLGLEFPGERTDHRSENLVDGTRTNTDRMDLGRPHFVDCK